MNFTIPNLYSEGSICLPFIKLLNKAIRSSLLCICFLLVISTICRAQAPVSNVEHPPNGHNSPYRIDFKDLNKDPDYYDGQPVKTIGYLNLQFEVDALWLNKEYFHHSKLPDTLTRPIAVSFGSSGPKHLKRFNHHYVIVEAVFHVVKGGLGHHYNELEVKRIRYYNGKTPND